MEEPARNLDELAHAVIGAAIEVHRVLGPGYLESVYENALCAEFCARKIGFQRQKPFVVQYKDLEVGEGRIDILVEQQLIVELKAVSQLNDVHLAQVLSYLKANDLRLGLLINFNVKLLRDGIRRVVSSYSPLP